MHQHSSGEIAVAERSLRILGLLRSAESASAVRAALGHHTLDLHMVSKLPSDPASLAGADLLLVEINAVGDGELAQLEQLLSRQPIAVVATMTGQPPMESLRRLIRLGIADVVPQPIDAAELREAVRIAASRAFVEPTVAATVGNGRVVAYLKAGGGVGATSLAVQTACALGDKSDPAKVLLIDLDLQFGAAAIQLDLPQKTSVLDLAEAADRLDGEMIRSAVSHHPAGIDVLAAPEAITPFDALSPAAAMHLLNTARGEYASVLLDMPLAWTAWTRSLLARCDHLVLVVQMNVHSVRHARRQIDTLFEEGLEGIPVSVVANRVDTDLLGRPRGMSVAEVEKALGVPVKIVVPEDETLGRAALLGKPVADLSGSRGLVKTLRNVAKAAGLVEADGKSRKDKRSA